MLCYDGPMLPGPGASKSEMFGALLTGANIVDLKYSGGLSAKLNAGIYARLPDYFRKLFIMDVITLFLWEIPLYAFQCRHKM